MLLNSSSNNFYQAPPKGLSLKRKATPKDGLKEIYGGTTKMNYKVLLVFSLLAF